MGINVAADGQNEKLLQEITVVLNECMKQILLLGQACLSASQYEAYRKFVLDQFGARGLHAKIRELISKAMERAGAAKQVDGRKES